MTSHEPDRTRIDLTPFEDTLEIPLLEQAAAYRRPAGAQVPTPPVASEIGPASTQSYPISIEQNMAAFPSGRGDWSGHVQAAVVCAILGHFFWSGLFGPAALAFGWRGYHQIKETGQRGRALAIATIVYGGYLTLITALTVLRTIVWYSAHN